MHTGDRDAGTHGLVWLDYKALPDQVRLCACECFHMACVNMVGVKVAGTCSVMFCSGVCAVFGSILLETNALTTNHRNTDHFTTNHLNNNAPTSNATTPVIVAHYILGCPGAPAGCFSAMQYYGVLCHLTGNGGPADLHRRRPGLA